MAKKQFKAESKRLLDLMINSIYTNKEIFIRELISNASDAIDKLYYKCITEDITGISRSDFYIRITPDKENRTLTIEDNGIGMNKDELENNLGVIARSGSMDFKKTNEQKEDIDIIGQFGVGFYSAFMVSKSIKVISRQYGSDEAYVWQSEGADGYTIAEAEKDSYGTQIILTIKDNSEEEKYDTFLNEYTIKQLVKRYSDYIRYPIIMNVEKHKLIEATEEEKNSEDYTPEYDHYFEDETINSMVPLWKRAKTEISEEDYNNFYKDKFFDFNEPLKVIHANIEGNLNYNALMFIPSQTPYNYYTRDYEKGLQLYSSGVLIMDKSPELLPDYFSFVRGLVDTQDLSLNISREMLQHDRQLRAIAVRIEKKIKSELEDMLKNDREKYETFFANFGLQLKYGIYSGYGANKEVLQDLVMFKSSFEGKYSTLKEYVERMKPDQNIIYYACGDSVERIEKMPQCEMLKDKGYEILYLTDDVDEFALKMLATYEEKEFRNATDDDLGIELTEEEKKSIEESSKENEKLLEAVKTALSGKVKEVRLSQRLKEHAVCFASGAGISIEMQKVLNQLPNSEKIEADKILEINPNHKIFASLKSSFDNDENEKVEKYSRLLYELALLIEGLPIDDPVDLSNLICDLMA